MSKQKDLFPATFELGCLSTLVLYGWGFASRGLAWPGAVACVAIAVYMAVNLSFCFSDWLERRDTRLLLHRVVFHGLLAFPAVLIALW